MTARKRKVVEFNAQTHAYYVRGTRYGSVTALAKKMQNGYALEQYGKRQVAIGLAQRPDLIHVVQSHHGDTGADVRNKINDVCEQAYEAAKASSAANTGTAIHTVLERIDKGEEFVPLDAAMAQVQIDYRAALDKAGLVAISSLVERIVVFPDYNLAGTFDRGYTEIKFDRGYTEINGGVVLGDVKSGINAISYPHSMAAQLGLYSLAPTMYDPVADELVEPPVWHGCVIAHTPITGGVELWSMDLDMCREVAEHALWLHRWMKRGAPEIVKQWIVPAQSEENEEWHSVKKIDEKSRVSLAKSSTSSMTSTSSTETTTTSAAPFTSAAIASDVLSGSSTQPADPFDGIAAPIPPRRAWIIDRLKVLRDAGAMDAVAIRWPDGVPTLKASDAHTDADYDRIVTVLNDVEAEYTITFEDKDPTKQETIGRWKPADPSLKRFIVGMPDSTEPDKLSTPDEVDWAYEAEIQQIEYDSYNPPEPDEGADAEPDAVAALQTAYEGLPAEARSWIAGIARDANKAGRPIHLAGTPTVRRFEIVRGLVALGAAGYDEDEIVRGLIDLTIGTSELRSKERT